MQIEDAFRAHREGRFEMNASKIELVQRATQAPRRYSGPGCLEQDSYGRLLVKCFAQASIADGMAPLSESPSSGELYGEAQYYDCSITDHNDQIWVTDPILIQVSYSFVTKAAAIKAPIRRLTRRLGSRATGWTITLKFRDQNSADWWALIGQHSLDMPMHGPAATLDIAENEGTVSVTVNSETALPRNFESCLVQALEFLVGEDLTTVTSDYSSPSEKVVSLFAGKQKHFPRASFPPIDPRQPEARRNGVRLLGMYLDYILSDSSDGGTGWHPLSGYAFQVRQVTGSSLGTWAVVLSVAVEGVAKLVQFTPPVSNTTFTEISDKVGDFLQAASYSETMVKRVKGLLTGMGSVSAKDRMYNLVNAGAVLKSDIDAWSKLRNSAVHTKQVTDDDIVDAKVQEQMNLLLKVHRLLHSMIFHVIGYSGPFTNYPERDFPPGNYPFPVIQLHGKEVPPAPVN